MKTHFSLHAGVSVVELQQFYKSYVETALWSSMDDDGDPLDSNYNQQDLAVEAQGAARKDCKNFLAKAETLIRSIDDSREGFSKAGHDFWLTRNGHGAGFWDGGWGNAGEPLSKIAKSFPNVDPYISKGRIYF